MIKKFLLLSLLLPAAVYSQMGARFLSIPTDAISMSTGGTSCLMDATAYTGICNPAGIVMSEKTMAAAVSYMGWQPHELHDNYFSLAGYYKITPKIGLTFQGMMLLSDSYDLYNDIGTYMGAFRPKEYSFGIGAAYRITEYLSAGANVKYLVSQLSSSEVLPGYKNASAFAVDLSLMYVYRRLNVAAGLANLGSNLKYGDSDSFTKYRLPSMFYLGAAFNFEIAEKHVITAAVKGECLMYDGEVLVGGGLRYCFNDMLSARGGYHYGNSGKLVPEFASVGIGVKVFGVELDAGYIIAKARSPLQNSFMITAGYEF